ncbi:MAG: glycine betaine ABC transporter substrate-binding protein [Candidatus Dormibacteria bacterium]
MKRIIMALTLLITPALVAGCGGGNSGPSGSSAGATTGCPVPSGSSGNGAHVSIGSKSDVPEDQLVAEMTKLVLEKHGFTVDNTFKATDKSVGNALRSGTIDMLWQYTGTELGLYLGLTGFPTDLHQAFLTAQQKDHSLGLCWTSETPFNDTNGLAVKQSDVGTYGDSLTALGTYLQAHPQTTVCVLSAFLTRPDGVPGLVSKYSQSYAASNVNYKTSSATAEKSIASGQCPIGEVFTTDSAIGSNNLVALKDDKQLFPPDNLGLVVRQSVLQQHPAIAALMAPVAAKLTTSSMVTLNGMIDSAGDSPQAIQSTASTWLTQNGF